ncbi:MAG TPA: TonB-dependent receptor plug domain-containing protein [Opitutaceae bacterium]|nr:TonB-dependent receptor plug domain-containing protein [Opitutaceae bacterium]
MPDVPVNLQPAVRRLMVIAGFMLCGVMSAAPTAEFDIAPQDLASALLLFARQAGVEVLFATDEVRGLSTPGVHGRYEPERALTQLLRGNPMLARRSESGKFIIAVGPAAGGEIRGRLLTPDGAGAAGLRISVAGAEAWTATDARGRFRLGGVQPGEHRLLASGAGFRPLEITGVVVRPNRTVTLNPHTVETAGELTQLEPFVVEAGARPGDRITPGGPRRVTGNLDLARTENDALPFVVYGRDEVMRSGVVDLNEFLQRAVLESDASVRPPEQDVNLSSFSVGSTNLKLRGYSSDETVVLINGRRLPEVLTNLSGSAPPDVNFIPLGLVERIEVLPVSASALYSGNPVGGVINILLRPDTDATEFTATYTNALGGYDAAQSTLSFQHGQSLLDGALRLRLSTSHTRIHPATEAELGYRQQAAQQATLLPDRLYRATPNVRSAAGTPLFGPDSASYTSVAPGADGRGGLAAFNGREGVRSLDFFDPPGGLAVSLNSLDSPYARRQQRTTWFGSIAYDVFPWLQLGLDGAHVRTVINRGHDVLTGDLTLDPASVFNPFGQTVAITLNESTPRLGENYNEAHIDYTSLLAGALLRLPADWQLSADIQAARNVSRYRGLAGVDHNRWQQLVDQGRYNPLRDTQLHAPPAAFYEEVLLYQGGPDRFVKVGDYRTLDAAVRLTQPALPLPTGAAVLNLGADYRQNRLAGFTDEKCYADGSLAQPPEVWAGRTLERYSFFGEMQAPLLPRSKLPSPLRGLEASLAVRYLASDLGNETNTAPTLGLRAEFAGGLMLRGSVTTANRMPTPQMSRRLDLPAAPGSGLNLARIFDPRRNESYDVQADEALDILLNNEQAVTQTAGIVLQRGSVHRFRLALDFVATTKANEILGLDPQAVLNLESVFPERVQRAPEIGGVPGLVSRVQTGPVNASERRSQNWTGSADYLWSRCFGGTLALRGRLLWFQNYTTRLFSDGPRVNQLDRPDGSTPGLLRYRANFGAAWSNRDWGFGLDGQYFHSRRLPVAEWPSQAGRDIKPYWQQDIHAHINLARWLPGLLNRRDLRAQLRINNVFDAAFPRYANDPSGAGVQPYGDWRRRTYSLSVSAAF